MPWVRIRVRGRVRINRRRRCSSTLESQEAIPPLFRPSYLRVSTVVDGRDGGVLDGEGAGIYGVSGADDSSVRVVSVAAMVWAELLMLVRPTLLLAV